MNAIESLLDQWKTLHIMPKQSIRTVGDVQEYSRKRLAILEQLKSNGYQEKLDGFTVQELIDDTLRNLKEMHETLSRY